MTPNTVYVDFSLTSTLQHWSQNLLFPLSLCLLTVSRDFRSLVKSKSPQETLQNTDLKTLWEHQTVQCSRVLFSRSQRCNSDLDELLWAHNLWRDRTWPSSKTSRCSCGVAHVLRFQDGKVWHGCGQERDVGIGPEATVKNSKDGWHMKVRLCTRPVQQNVRDFRTQRVALFLLGFLFICFWGFIGLGIIRSPWSLINQIWHLHWRDVVSLADWKSLGEPLLKPALVRLRSATGVWGVSRGLKWPRSPSGSRAGLWTWASRGTRRKTSGRAGRRTTERRGKGDGWREQPQHNAQVHTHGWDDAG